MVTALLIVIYIAFIGNGFTQSLFGAALPAIQGDLALSLDMANYVNVLIPACTAISSMFGGRMVNKFGTRAVLTASTVLAALSLLGFSFANGIVTMCIFAIPLGLSAGATDAALNNYISLHYKAMHMNFMHCFFGVGMLTGPVIMAFVLDSAGWRAGYRTVFALQCVIVLIVLLSLPIWKKVKHASNTAQAEAVVSENLSYFKMIKRSEIRLDWYMCIAINAIEGGVGSLGAWYLVNAHGLSEASSAAAITMFCAGIALGRFLSGIISNKVSSRAIVKVSVGIMLLGTALMFVPVTAVAIAGLFLVGLGNGPIYPSIMYLTPQHFGEKHSTSILSSQMAAAYFGFMVGAPVFGSIAKMLSPSAFPLYILVWGAIFVVSAMLFFRKISKNK